ncbi:hypothetical protein L6164_032099 [Bauhinia variegata]|uniref:Uncharacterized protein n=1 Tax=Bauhinia variegata TaxID=167791 RepID=A0ACB9KMI7_BAUVA|nr:hypothetical protein L6164_032099 [Bauhinia variegata]
MEPAECISEEWSSLSGFYTAEEADFMTQLLGNSSVSVLNNGLNGNSDFGIPSAIWPATESAIVSMTGIGNTCLNPSNANDPNLFCLLQGDSCNSYSNTTKSGENYSSSENCIGSLSMGFCLEDANISHYSVQGIGLLSQVINENIDQESEEDERKITQNSAKRSRSTTEAPKNKKNVRSKKMPKSASVGKNVNEDDGCPGLQGQRSSSCCSEDESDASQELNGGASSSLSPKDPAALKLNGKARATKGSVADPQSLYARRRERINERLRILQNLVPNGTKVDISTMLEEAVQYVKFLQLQIKLLSSDDLWMYAPIAYNGMNIGLELNITPTKQP